MKAWDDLLTAPIFVLTSDQDWAPAWACDALLAEVRTAKVPLHVFRTNPCPSLDAAFAANEITQGWHPNFLAGSSHGATTEEVIAYCARHFPGARTVRSHAYAEDTHRWLALRSAGIVADSQICTAAQAHIAPLLHWTGVVRLPVYLEDDVYFMLSPDELALEKIEPTLFTPGLKVLNFHPTFVGCNTPSLAHYESRKSAIFASREPSTDLVNEGQGTRTLLTSLIARIQAAGHTFESYDVVAERFVDHARTGFGSLWRSDS